VTGCQDLNSTYSAGSRSWPSGSGTLARKWCGTTAENLLHIAVATMSKAMFIFLPLIAFLHMLLYWRPRYRYAEHLLFFVHLHAFYFTVAIVMVCAGTAAESWPKVSGVSDILETALGWCLPIYTLLAMRRVFQRSWAGTLFKAVILFFVYSIVFGLTVASVVVYAAGSCNMGFSTRRTA